VNYATASKIGCTRGAASYYIIRGIERRAIFEDDFGRENFIKRLSTLVPQTQSICYEWVLAFNHAHFLQLHFSRILYFFMDIPI
jgi:putative transposase